MSDEMRYFSERESGEVLREAEEIGANAWRGILAKLRARSVDASFGAAYPAICPDGNYVVGTDEASFSDAIRAEIPELSVYDEQDYSGHHQPILDTLSEAGGRLPTLDILDLIEFCWKSVGKPREIGDHSYFMHSHLAFDRDTGREQFCDEIENIFRRNGVAYKLTEEGRVERLMSLEFQGILVESDFDTGDAELNRLLSTAQRKFLDPRPETRREALEALWDAWERVKTMDGHSDKKAGVQAILDTAAGATSPKFRQALDREAAELTGIGNSLRIRHSETSQEILATSEHVDYLFYRLYSLIQLVLKSR